jgi:hypothetical protein
MAAARQSQPDQSVTNQRVTKDMLNLDGVLRVSRRTAIA